VILILITLIFLLSLIKCQLFRYVRLLSDVYTCVCTYLYCCTSCTITITIIIIIIIVKLIVTGSN